MKSSRNYREIVFPDHRHLTKDECYALFTIYSDRSLPLERRILARNYLIMCSQKLIKKFVDEFWRHHQDKKYVDLWAAAVEGFIISFEKADINKLQDTKFDTYASYWMKAYMVEASQNDGIIRYASSYHRKMSIASKKMRKKMKNASPHEIRSMLNEFDNEWGNFRNNSGSSIASIDQKNRNRNATIADTIAANENYNTVNIVGRNIFRKELHKTLERLNNIEKRIIKATYEVESQGSNFNELSSELGIPKKKVIKIRNDALIKMRKDTEFKQILSSLNMMASLTNGSNVFNSFI